MAGTLQSRLGVLALEFSESVLEAIRGASLGELFGESAARGAPAAPRARAVRATPTASAVRPAAPAAPSTPRGRKPGAGRLSRRSPSDIERVVSEIVSLLAESAEGLRAEEIRRRLGLVSKELPRPLKEGLDSGRIGKSGQKRATTYFIAGAAGAVAKGPAAGARKAARAGAKPKVAPRKTSRAKAKKGAAGKRGGSKRGARPARRSAKATK